LASKAFTWASFCEKSWATADRPPKTKAASQPPGRRCGRQRFEWPLTTKDSLGMFWEFMICQGSVWILVFWVQPEFYINKFITILPIRRHEHSSKQKWPWIEHPIVYAEIYLKERFYFKKILF
jgi:hypothetical protein